jgi:hypothetical protein
MRARHWLLFLCAGCAPKAVEPGKQPAPAAPLEGAAPVTGFAAGRSRVEVAAQAVTLLLPDRRAWRAEKQGSWTLLKHAPTDSRLLVKQWRAARLVTPGECREQARLGQPALVELREEEIVERRRIQSPVGFDGELVIAVRQRERGLQGLIQLAAAALGRCYVALFDTSTAGSSSAPELAARLEIVVKSAFERARPTAIEDRARANFGR